MKNKLIAVVLVVTLLHFRSFSQCPGALTHDWDIPMTFPNQTMTCVHDLNKDFLYVAGKEQGLLIYDLSNINSPALALNIPSDSLLGLDNISITQDGNYLYLALGNIFDDSQHSGMAIIDVTVPAQAHVTDVWQLNSVSGAGIVKVQGNYAFLGAMKNGLIILNVADKNNIQFVSQFIPDLSFPTANPDTAKYNARGMQVIGDILYLCFDAGGLRIINIHDKQNPVQTGEYSLQFLNTHPRAYNNIVVSDSLAYITIDYCGLEILNVSDTSNITQVGWWNPWDCGTATNNWFNSRGHSNELRLVKNCGLVFMSTGKSQINVVDVSDPAAPDSCTMFGTQADQTGTWGLDVWHNKVFGCYIFVPLGIPFFSNWAGVKMLAWNNVCDDYVNEVATDFSFNIFPNPVSEQLTVNSSQLAGSKITVTDFLGREMFREITNQKSSTGLREKILNLKSFAAGVYFIKVTSEKGMSVTQRFIKL